MEIKTFVETLKFKLDAPRAAIGTVNGYYTTFFAGSFGFSVVPYFTFLLEETVTDDLKAEVAFALNDFKIDVSAENDVLILIVGESLATIQSAAVDALKSALVRTTNVLIDRGVKQPAVCRFCGLVGADSYHYQSGIHRPVHDSCLREYLASEEPPSPAIPVIDAESFAKSVLFALLGGVAAAVPVVLAAIYYPIFYTFLLALIPLGSFVGYRAGKGVVRKRAIAIVVAFDHFLAFSLIIWCWNMYARAEGETLFAYLAADNLVPFVFDAVIGILLTTIGTVLSKRLLPLRKI